MDAVVQYLEESSILCMLDVTVSNMARDIDALVTDEPKKMASNIVRTTESFENHLQSYIDLSQKVHEFEVMPGRILVSSLEGIKKRKAESVNPKIVLL